MFKPRNCVKSTDLILDKILATDIRIRYAGIMSDDLGYFISKVRKHVAIPIEKKEADDKLVRLAAPVILGVLSQITEKCGKLICCGVRFDKMTLMFFRMGDLFVAVIADPGPPYPIMKKLEERFQNSARNKYHLPV